MNVTNRSLAVEIKTENSSESETSFLTYEIQLTLTLILVLIVLVGIAGNVMLMAMLLRTKAFRANATSVFVLNLSCADLLFVLFCVPFQGTVYILNNWPYGFVPCKTTHFFQYVTMFASIWLLTVMSVDRYFALKHPLKAVAFRTPKMAARYSVIVWLLACLVQVTACLDIWPEGTFFLRKWLIWLVIRSRYSQKTFRQRRRVAFLVFCLALMLFVFWLPHNISLIWINFGEVEDWGQEFFIYKVTAHMLSYLNSCINPFICFFMSKNLQTVGLAGRSHGGSCNADACNQVRQNVSSLHKQTFQAVNSLSITHYELACPVFNFPYKHQCCSERPVNL
ncbi:7tm 1 domain containing protein [Trichuris trichiura]|uniref:7tm 1 domain containing protein n=1 Tax=Trichuris trichiura TaxID=36087 RepID=A0A077ZDJ5_TRITR|nr:7tm 1 domain containing protein [Trichuris trichiura]